jgi:dTDP-L-rhamnose 4-epimerase
MEQYMKVLITGGAGFVGSHTADALIEGGHAVRVFDNLDPQVHGENPSIPEYLNPKAEFVRGDVRDREALKRSIKGIDAIYHLAAAVGVGQSMYEVQKYVDINSLGGAILLDILANEEHNVKKVIVASSMSIYGEGQYQCQDHGNVYPTLRLSDQLEARDWEMHCPNCSRVVSPMPTGEGKPLFPTSIYAVTKRDHEEMFLTIGRAYHIPTVALRYFNIYGSRQALSNPYTGVAAIFSSRLLNHNSPIVFEDGLQSRDFIHVSDIVQANMLALEKDEANYEVFNVGTGRQLTILGQFREGDIRHCYADISKIQSRLGFTPEVAFEDGMDELVNWVATQQASDLVENARAQLAKRNLVK